jgi:hypothetical protein
MEPTPSEFKFQTDRPKNISAVLLGTLVLTTSVRAFLGGVYDCSYFRSFGFRSPIAL